MSMTFATDVQVNGTNGVGNIGATGSISADGSVIADGPIGTGGHKIFYGTCSTAAGTVAKVVTCPSFTSADLVAGALIYVFFAKTNSGAVADLTLNVNSTGAKNIKKIYNAAIKNLTAAGEIQANMTYLFTYNGSYWVMSTMDYNNTYTPSNNVLGNGSYIASNAVARYNMLFQVDENHLTPLCSGNSTATTKTMLTNVSFDAFGLILYYTTNAAVAANGTIAVGSAHYSCTGVDLRYSFNVDDSTNTLTAHKNVYLKVVVTSNINQKECMVKIDSSMPLVQDLPTTATEDGSGTGISTDRKCYLYILLGRAYNGYCIALYPHHPVYAWTYNYRFFAWEMAEITKDTWRQAKAGYIFHRPPYGTKIFQILEQPDNTLSIETELLETEYELTLKADDWSDEAPYTQSITGTATTNLNIWFTPILTLITAALKTTSLTADIYQAASEACIECTRFIAHYESDGTTLSKKYITFTAFGEKPTIDIPVIIRYPGEGIRYGAKATYSATNGGNHV